MVMNQGAFRDMLSSVRGEEKAKALDVDLPPQFGRAHGSNLRVALVGRPDAGCSPLSSSTVGFSTSCAGGVKAVESCRPRFDASSAILVLADAVAASNLAR